MISSIDELKELRERIISEAEKEKPCIVISAGTCGQASGANDLIRIVKRKILEKNLHDRILLRITGCHGFCEMEPSILVEPEGIFYPKLKIDNIKNIIDTVLHNDVVEELLYKDPVLNEKFKLQNDIPFFKKQKRLILGLNQLLDPIRIFNYIENNGYKALENVLLKSDPAWIIEEVKASGLRGRGGAGFPTGLKWQLARAQNLKREKYVVCNADEGDPGAYMDRAVLEGNPHLIIEGMIIGGFAIGATRGFIYVRTEYPLAIKNLTIALRQAYEMRLLGKNILGTGFDFDISIVRGAGAFVCGEETALMKSIEGFTGEPRQRPPYPTEKGIWGNPTCINNVETWANIPIIFTKGAEAISSIGTSKSKGTKIFSLVGKVRNTGLVEVPMGTTIEEIVYDIGGGAVNGRKIKAVQTGGPSGGCIPSELFDLPIDYESLTSVGSIMGSGGMIVMDDKTCMVDVAKYFLNFLKDESCGKCFTCRKGTQRMHEIVTEISEGKSSIESLVLLEELGNVVKESTMCGLGNTAPNPVLSTLRYFKNEYHEHIEQHKCPAGVCKALIKYVIDKEKCPGCLLCKKICPQGAIYGEKNISHVIDSIKCNKCGSCLSVCKYGAIYIE